MLHKTIVIKYKKDMRKGNTSLHFDKWIFLAELSDYLQNV